MKASKFLVGLLILLATLVLVACSMIRDIEAELEMLRQQTVLALNDGINELEKTSSDWKVVLDDLHESIDGRIQDIVTYNIPYITNIASQRLLSSALCVKENLKDEIVYYLEIMRAELITGELPPLPQTTICLTSVSAIDLNAPREIRSLVIYTGYHIHSLDSINALLVSEDAELKISSQSIGFPDMSNITVSLEGLSDEALAKYTYLVLRYGETIISRMSIIKKTPVPPIIKTVFTNSTSIVWIPPHTNGDKEFSGNGPIMFSHVELKYTASKVFARVYLKARETKKDWTTASGWSNWKEIYNVPNGYRINHLNEANRYVNILRVNGVDYVDDDHRREHIIETPVGRATLIGDSSGDDAGTDTRITLNLKRFSVEIQKK